MTDRRSSAIAGQDAVISLLGPTGKSTGMPISEGMRNIVEAMQANGVMRLIATATPSASDPHDRFSLPFWLAIRMIKALAGTAYADITAEVDVIRTSQLDWTIVRLPWLTSKPNPRRAVAGYVGDPRIKLFFLSRQRLAEFVVE
ncbi:NAD(P)-binding oxidoreductase [Bradyrhizobium sp. AT1]|uniref:NAD(P)-dependent oxidoreductase n=1 Tax=Bradyrhizobium sp. AT1 TaxID=574934 RepID=UPI001FDA7B0B|nr:NAD(P)-binding oxidoreductase [Bradyrhizobium sp. AT1]